MATFLLELLTEEIPANALPGARDQLERFMAAGLDEVGLACDVIRSLSTSRRLIVLVEGLPERQPDRTERVSGPPRKVAYTDDGSPTKAAEGFARKVGLAVDELEIDSTPKGDYLAATVTHEGRPTPEILAELVPPVIEKLRFPKIMRWGLGEFSFVRPVHGVVALCDDEIVPIVLFGRHASRTTTGHRVHSPEPFDLAHADDYQTELERRSVQVDPVARRSAFSAVSTELVAGVDCRVHPDDSLMAEHVELL